MLAEFVICNGQQIRREGSILRIENDDASVSVARECGGIFQRTSGMRAEVCRKKDVTEGKHVGLCLVLYTLCFVLRFPEPCKEIRSKVSNTPDLAVTTILCVTSASSASLGDASTFLTRNLNGTGLLSIFGERSCKLNDNRRDAVDLEVTQRIHCNETSD